MNWTPSGIARLLFALLMMYIMGRQDQTEHTYTRLIIMGILIVGLAIGLLVKVD